MPPAGVSLPKIPHRSLVQSPPIGIYSMAQDLRNRIGYHPGRRRALKPFGGRAASKKGNE